MITRRSLHSAEGLGQLADLCWDELQHWFKPDCCVMATAVFCDVMAQLGHRQVEPQSVTAYFYNPIAAAHVMAHKCLGVDCLDLESRSQGATVVVLGAPRPGVPESPLDWHGHLVAIVERRWLVDLSVSQASHPERGVPIEDGAFVHEIPRSWLRRETGVWGITDANVTVCYQASTDRSWEHCHDWAQSGTDSLRLRAQLVRAIVARWRGETPPPYSEAVRLVHAIGGRI